MTSPRTIPYRRLLAGIGTLALLTAACGDDDDTGSSDTTASEPSDTDAASSDTDAASSETSGASGTLGEPIPGIAWDSDLPVPTCDLSEFDMVYVSVLRENPVLRIMAQGAIDGAEAMGFGSAEWLAPTGFDEPATAALGDQAIAQDIDGMVVFATSDAFYPMIERAADAGIPVVETHSPIEEGDAPGVLNVVAPDPLEFGAAAADSIAAELEAAGTTSGTVAVTQTALILNENLAAEGFTERMNELLPDLNVLPGAAVGGDFEQTIANETAIVQANPDLVAAFGTYGNAPVTWAQTMEDTGTDLVVIGMDYARENLELVEDGTIHGIAAQPLYQEHYEGSVILGLHLCGEADDVPYRLSPPAPIVTADGLDPYFNLVDSVNID